MTKHHLMNSSALALACAMLLAGCDKQEASAPAATQSSDALPLTSGPPTDVAPAPAAEALPPAPRPRIVAVANPQDDYAYIDRAYAMSDAIGDAPPDYGFDYQDSHPWVWRSASRATRLVEPVPGGYRDYYYQAGASEPYLVRDPQYSYGFSGGELVAVYDNDGQLLPERALDQRADDAGRYLARAEALYTSALRSERRAINAANWAAQQAALNAERTQWQAEQNRQAAWRDYHAAHEAQDRNDWQAERTSREQSARSFNEWSARGFNGPPPGRGNPQQQNDQARAQQQQVEQARQQQAQQDAAHQAQAGAQQRQIEQARQQQAQQDAAHQAQAKAQQQQIDQARQQQAQQDAAHQAQAKAQQQQIDQARQQQAQQRQIEQARQQQAQQDAAHQAQAKAQQQQADQARQQQAQQDAARQAQAKAQQLQADQARQQQAQQDAARQAQAKAQQQQAEQARPQQAQARDAADSNRRGQRGGRDNPVAAPVAASPAAAVAPAAAAPAPVAPVPAVAAPAAKPPVAPVPAAAQTPPVRPRGKGRADHRDDTPPPQ